jgi:SAM-dependent methyltransferase
MTKRDIAYWWRTHCEDDPQHRSSQQLKTQIDAVERFLALEPRSRVLDLACGMGRQTLELARRGHRVLGLDADDTALSAARQSARGEKLNVHFLKNDIRLIPYRAEFDAVVNFFTSFGYFPSERDDLKALEAVQKSLKPGGRLLLDLLNKEWLMRHFEPNVWEQGEEGRGAVALDDISFNFESGRLENRRTIINKDGSRTPAFVSVRIYTLTEIKSLVARAGLTYRQSFGGFDGVPYGMDSPRMIVLADKTVERRAPKKTDDLPTAIRIKGRRR